MAQSWRLKTFESDNTEKTATSTPISGATVVISPKGPNKFVRFNKGDTQGILDTFGYPSVDYPTIQDALDVVTKCSMLVKSAYGTDGKYGGVFITKRGTVPFNEGVADKKEFLNNVNYNAISASTQIAISDGTTTQYSATLPFVFKESTVENNEPVVKDYSRYNIDSIKLLIDGSDMVISTSYDSETKIETLTKADLLDEGSQLNTETGALILNFTSAVANAKTISVSFTMNLADTYCVLFDKNMQEDDLEVKVISSDDVDKAFEIIVARLDPLTQEYSEVSNSPYLVGLSDTSKDSYGDNIYIENVFGSNQQLFDAHVVTSIVDTFEDDSDMVQLKGGSRGNLPTPANVASSYDELIDTSKFQIKFCVDGTGSSDVANEFRKLRINYQRRCRYLYPTGTSATTGNQIVESPNMYNYGITDQRGMYQYCLTWGIHKDVYQGNDFLCSNMGLVAGTLVDAMNAGYGYANAWIPENGVGGILGSSITKLSIEGTSEDTLEALDNLNFNAVVNDYNYGAMIVGWRTRQVKKTIFSNIPQSSLADNIIELIEKEVMPSRIGKLIDEASFSVVRSGVSNIMSAYSNFFEDYYVWCDADNNPPETREREELHLTVGVVFKNLARMVILNFVTMKSGTNVEEFLKQN